MPKPKWKLNTIYISERLQESLRPISRCALTTVVAPMGYGKTTAVNWYLEERAKAGPLRVVRISVYSDNLAIFWRSAQDAFARAGIDLLREYACPTDAAGGGLAVECSPAFENDVQITAVKNMGTKSGYNARTWTKHGKLPYIEYDNAAPVQPDKPDTGAGGAIKTGSVVRVKQGAKTYAGGGLASFVYERDHVVSELNGDRAVITYGGVTVAAVRVSDLVLADGSGAVGTVDFDSKLLFHGGGLLYNKI